MWAEILECGLHDVFFNVNNFLHNMADTVERTLDDFAKLLKIILKRTTIQKVFQVMTKVIWIVSLKFEAKN